MWHMVNYAQIGRGHIRKKIPCQDKTVARQVGDIYLLGLADGAGSAKFSHFGAETTLSALSDYIAASNNFAELINDNDGIQVRSKVLSCIVNALTAKATELNCDIKDLASTLLFVAIKQNQFMLFHLGDGVIGVRKSSGLKTASKPDNGEFANSTVFTTSKNALKHMKIFKGTTDDIYGFVFMSDGTETSLYQKRTAQLAPVIVKIMNKNALSKREIIMRDIVRDFDIIVNNTQDDCSLAIISRMNDTVENYLALSPHRKAMKLRIKNWLVSRKKVKRYDDILSYLYEPRSIQQIAEQLKIRIKYVYKHLDLLRDIGMIKKLKDNTYMVDISKL